MWYMTSCQANLLPPCHLRSQLCPPRAHCHSRAGGNLYKSSLSFPHRRESIQIKCHPISFLSFPRLCHSRTGGNLYPLSSPRRRESIRIKCRFIFSVIPAQAGIYINQVSPFVIPAQAGIYTLCHSRAGGNPYKSFHPTPKHPH